jgi:hypothetical protein
MEMTTFYHIYVKKYLLGPQQVRGVGNGNLFVTVGGPNFPLFWGRNWRRIGPGQSLFSLSNDWCILCTMHTQYNRSVASQTRVLFPVYCRCACCSAPTTSTAWSSPPASSTARCRTGRTRSSRPTWRYVFQPVISIFQDTSDVYLFRCAKITKQKQGFDISQFFIRFCFRKSSLQGKYHLLDGGKKFEVFFCIRNSNTTRKTMQTEKFV